MGLLNEFLGVSDHLVSFDNCRIILANNEIENGSLLVEDGVIREVCPVSAPSSAHRIDLDGKILMPGLIDLHSDAIEREVEPRPRTFLPFELAVRQADRLFANVGVTTAYHSLSFWGDDAGVRGNQYNADFSRTIAQMSSQAIIDNRVHARFEITNRNGLQHIQDIVAEGVISLASLMDHTPGQGQYPDASQFKDYLKSTGMSEVDIDEYLAKKMRASEESRPEVEALAKTCRDHHVPLASHDDDLPSRFDDHEALGVTISEFPMNPQSGRAGMERGFTVLVGSPNIMRGVSSGAGPKAIDLLSGEAANALCSDYMPATILPAIFKISSELGWPFWKAARLGTIQPALGARLSDRGEIATGKRADLIVVESHRDWPIVRYLFSAGRLSYASVPVEARGRAGVELA